MSEDEATYRGGMEVIDEYGEKLAGELPELCPDEGERAIVEGVLLPEFREKLKELVEDFRKRKKKEEEQRIVPGEIPELCTDVDEMVVANRVLLDVDGVFAPVIDRIWEVRGEVGEALRQQFYEHCREILAEKGVTDRNGLRACSHRWYVEQDFHLYGKGKTFVGKILGEKIISVCKSYLERVADLLDLPDFSEERKEELRQLLGANGIFDEIELMRMGVKGFSKKQFPPYGRGTPFAKMILNIGGRDRISRSQLRQIAKILDLPRISEERKREMVSILKSAGIEDSVDLSLKGVMWFQDQNFGSYGKGQAFVNIVLEDSDMHSLKSHHLDRFAAKLDLPRLSEDRKREIRELFRDNGIFDRRGLSRKTMYRFKTMEFPPYGKGVALASLLLGRSCRELSTEIVNEVAAAIDMPTLSEESKESFRKVLRSLGIHDRNGLCRKSVRWLKAQSYAPFGGLVKFVTSVLGRSCHAHLGPSHIEEVSEALDLPILSDVSRGEFIKVLESKGINDKDTFLAKYLTWFQLEEFPPYGKGMKFLGLVLGRPLGKSFQYSDIKEAADLLFD